MKEKTVVNTAPGLTCNIRLGWKDFAVDKSTWGLVTKKKSLKVLVSIPSKSCKWRFRHFWRFWRRKKRNLASFKSKGQVFTTIAMFCLASAEPSLWYLLSRLLLYSNNFRIACEYTSMKHSLLHLQIKALAFSLFRHYLSLKEKCF